MATSFRRICLVASKIRTDESTYADYAVVQVESKESFGVSKALACGSAVAKILDDVLVVEKTLCFEFIRFLVPFFTVHASLLPYSCLLKFESSFRFAAFNQVVNTLPYTE